MYKARRDLAVSLACTDGIAFYPSFTSIFLNIFNVSQMIAKELFAFYYASDFIPVPSHIRRKVLLNLVPVCPIPSPHSFLQVPQYLLSFYSMPETAIPEGPVVKKEMHFLIVLTLQQCKGQLKSTGSNWRLCYVI